MSCGSTLNKKVETLLYAVSGGHVSVTAEVSAGGNIDVGVTFSITSGGCSISESEIKTISDLQDGQKGSTSWTVTMGSATCVYSLSAVATGAGGIASKTDSVTGSITLTSQSPGGNLGGGGSGSGSSVADEEKPVAEEEPSKEKETGDSLTGAVVGEDAGIAGINYTWLLLGLIGVILAVIIIVSLRKK